MIILAPRKYKKYRNKKIKKNKKHIVNMEIWENSWQHRKKKLKLKYMQTAIRVFVCGKV